MMNLSYRAKTLWAKSPNEYGAVRWPEGSYLPLFLHMSDSVEIAKHLWEHWVPESTKRLISDDLEVARRFFLFSAAAHDLGKASPVFQSKVGELLPRVLDAGLKVHSISADGKKKASHALVGFAIMRDCLMAAPYVYSKEEANSFAVVLGGHHGVAPQSDLIGELGSWPSNTGFSQNEWVEVQRELFAYAVDLSGINLDKIKDRKLSVKAQVILTGLVIMSDWLASDEGLFPYLSNEFPRKHSSTTYAAQAWDNLHLPAPWHAKDIWNKISSDKVFRSRFALPVGAFPRPLQQSAVDILERVEKPGIMVIEAPMGEGKTEAALIATEIMASRLSLGGVFMALPTQATTDGIFPRINKWIGALDRELHSLYLAHGKARFNEQYRDLAMVSPDMNIWDDDVAIDKSGSRDVCTGVIAHDWLQGRKKGILSDFVVGTIDQVLMGALQRRHLALRHLGLANKVIIIDECHAYDAYMSQYLEMTLEWLGAYDVPVIILSATLPIQRRKAIVDAYMRTKTACEQPVVPWREPAKEKKPIPEWAETRAYPIITYSDGAKVLHREIDSSGRHTRVGIEFVKDEDIPRLIEDSLVGGGCIGIIRNTVKRAQETAKQMAALFGEDVVTLFHAQFLTADRIAKENDLRGKLGRDGIRPPLYIVVGTQVLEQSLDIDFDLIITDIAPADLLLQRMGRLHRHQRNDRPERLKHARYVICGVVSEDEIGIPKFDGGSEKIYGRYLLEATYARLRDVAEINLPDDISDIIQDVYGEADVMIPEAWRSDFDKARREHKCRIEKKESKADTYRIRHIEESDTIIDWLNTSISDSDAKAEASVRDTSDSIEVIIVQRKGEQIFLLPWIGESNGLAGAEMPTDRTPDDTLAGIVAGCTVHLPYILCVPSWIDSVIMEIEENALPYISHWQNSYWLKGALVLILDENFEAEIAGFKLRYEMKWGLSAERITEKK
jgi:CRISPR-associated helicase Cas3/CRISPR-associated endonuclease Cas3-HD